MDITFRGAVSLGRRVRDSLSELVKVRNEYNTKGIVSLLLIFCGF